MAQYKVLQDIEAEDKLLGPLTLRQFIYAIIVVVLGFIAFKLVTVQWYLAIPFLPPIGFFGLLAAPFGREQSSEVWLLAKIRFFVFPRKRLWDQTGQLDLVNITAPKKIEKNYTDGLSQTEVKSRLKALAATMDTRGWAVKNISSTYGYQAAGQANSSERLLQLQTVPSDALGAVKPSEDVLDPTNNPLARTMDAMVIESEQNHRLELLNKMQSASGNSKMDKLMPVVNSKTRPPKIPTTAAAAKPVSSNTVAAKPPQNVSEDITPATPIKPPVSTLTASDPTAIIKSDSIKPAAQAQTKPEPPEGEVVISLR